MLKRKGPFRCLSLDGLKNLVEEDKPRTGVKSSQDGWYRIDFVQPDTSNAKKGGKAENKSGCHVFQCKIRHSKKAKDATFYRQTPTHYSVVSGAAQITKRLRKNMCKSLGIWQQRKGDRKMAFNIMDLMNATTKAAAGENNEYQEITLGIRDIVVTNIINTAWTD